MLTRILTVVFWVWLSVLGFAQEGEVLYGGKLRFVPPSDLKSLSPDTIRREYKTVCPEYVYKNDLGDVSIAFRLMDKELHKEDLPLFRDRLEERIKEQMQVVKWLGTSMVDLNGVEWFKLDFKSLDQGYVIHNVVLGTSLGGKLLEVTFSSFSDADLLWAQKLSTAQASLQVVTP